MKDNLREIFLENIDSTNLWAKTNIEELEDKTIVFAGAQTQGRGRLQRKWVDLGKGNLFMSIVLKPDKNYEHYANLTQYLSVTLCKTLEEYGIKPEINVTLCKTLEEYGIKPEIKWPNDVLVNGKKIAGILAETSVKGTKFKGLVLGIGVNLNAQEKDFSKIDKKVTSLNLEVGETIDMVEFKNKLVTSFFKDYNQFLEEGFKFIKRDYLALANFLDKELCVALINETKTGVASGITDKGELMIKANLFLQITGMNLF